MPTRRYGPLPVSTWAPGRQTRERTFVELLGDYLLATESLPRETVARNAGVSTATLRKWERGLRRNENGKVRRRLIVYLARWEQFGSHPGATPASTSERGRRGRPHQGD